jgi:hypothetical protein
MSLKIYGWEHRQFRDMYDMHLIPATREQVIHALAKHFGIKLSRVEFVTYKNGVAYSKMGLIQLPRKTCPVGLVVHELAHVYDWQKNGKDGHRKTFRQALIKLMVETKYELPRISKCISTQH